MMTRPGKRFYSFDVFRVDLVERLLFREDREIPLTPKVFDTLIVLLENSSHVLTKQELMQQVWPDSFVEENNLAQNISILRKALGEQYIQAVPKRGYRFVGDVKLQEDETVIIRERMRGRIVVEKTDQPDFADIPKSIPETMYARSGDVNIAYQVVGDAPLDLVFVMGWVSHLEYCWREPSFARFLLRLASFSRLILFDKRGTGLSDRVPIKQLPTLDLVFVMGWVSHLEYCWREPSFARFLLRLASFSRLILFDKRGTGLSDRVPIKQLPTLEQRMDDVRAVMNAVGSERAALCGVSEGGPMCSLFAATYPEKTLALVMIGTYAKRIRDVDYPWGPTLEQREQFFEVMRQQWGGPVGIEERAPTEAHDPKFREWWAAYLRTGASPAAAVALTQMNAEIDVRNVLPSIRVPSLVIHRRDDQCLKVEEGRYVADRIPNAKFVELPGNDHLPFVGDQDAILDEMEEFLTGVRHRLEPDTVLATVLFTRIAGVDERVRQGNWEELLRRLRAHIAKEIEWFRG